MKFIKDNLRVVIAVVIASILIIIGVILMVINKEEDKTLESQIMKEEDIVLITGMSGNDAIDIVKKNFNDNNYDFSFEVTSDSLYKVTAKVKQSDEEIIYFVDPINGKAYINIDTK